MDNQTNATSLDLNALKYNLDVFFVGIMSSIILFMQCGFAFLEAGVVRNKNVTDALTKNVLCTSIAMLTYWGPGYAFAHGPGNFFLGWRYFFSENMPETLYHHWFFHMALAVTASNIAAGAWAERCEFIAYPVVTFALTGLIFPFTTHWCWHPSGWLKVGGGDGTGYQDFAGSGVVHIAGGTAAWMGAIILGPRKGRYDKGTGRSRKIYGHSIPLVAQGGFILILGLLAMNSGAAMGITDPGQGLAVIRMLMNTMISGGCSALVAVITMKIAAACSKTCCPGHTTGWTFLTLINATLTGMVAIAAGGNQVYPWGAAAIGAVAGWCYLAWSAILVEMKIDDPVHATAVHLGGGFLGLIASPILRMNNGIVYTQVQNSLLSLAWNVAGAAAIFGWTAVICVILLGSMRKLGLFRVSEEVEKKGLDTCQHKEPAYPSEEEEEEEEVEDKTGLSDKVLVANKIENGTNHAFINDLHSRLHNRSVDYPVRQSSGYDNPTFDATTMF